MSWGIILVSVALGGLFLAIVVSELFSSFDDASEASAQDASPRICWDKLATYVVTGVMIACGYLALSAVDWEEWNEQRKKRAAAG